MSGTRHTYVDGGTLIIPMPRELDHHSSADISDNLDLMLAGRGIRKVVLDFTDTEFMDSAGIGVILGKYKRVRAFGGQVSICGVNERIARIMQLSGINRIVPFYATPKQAADAKQ